MARRLGHLRSQSISRYRFLRPQVRQLEDRLPPGSMWDFFGVTATALSSNFATSLETSFTSNDVPVLALVPTIAASHDVNEIGSSQFTAHAARMIARTQEASQPAYSNLGDPLSTQALLSVNFGDDPSNKWLQPVNSSPKESAPARVGPTRVTLHAGDEDAFLSAPPKGATPATNAVNFATADMINVPALGAGVAAQNKGDDAALPRNGGGRRIDDPFQSMVPYSVTYNGTRDEPTTGVVRSPAEYDPMRGVIFSWASNTGIVTDMVKELTEDPTKDDIAYVVVQNSSQQSSATTTLANAGADMSKVQFFQHPMNAVWIRDYGPHFITIDNAPAIVDSQYYPDRPLDNFIPTLIGDNDLKVPTYDMGLYYSGGNFQPGPNNNAFLTSIVNSDNPAGDGFDANLISELYHDYQGIDTLNIFPALPSSVDGTGHIDMWMYLVDQDTVMISDFKAGSNSTAIQITNDAVTYMQNLGFTVYRPQAWNVGSTHFTYTNAFRVNDRIFVPVYGTAYKPGGNSSYNDEDADAIAKWQAAAGPGVEIIPIQCSSIIGSAGAIHCIVMQVPRYTGSAPAANVVSPSGGEILLKGSQHLIEWTAVDTNNIDASSIDIYVSFNGGAAYRHIATTSDTGSYLWTVNGRTTSNAIIKIVAHSGDGDETAAVSAPFTITSGTADKYDFSSGAGENKFGFGYQTTSWSGVNGNSSPVATAFTAGNYTAISSSDATGGNGDTNRYIAPNPNSNSESTHLFTFNLAEAISDIDEIGIHWEGYADNCSRMELYVWDNVAGNWGDGTGLTGNNRFMDSWAGNIDGSVDGYIRSNFSRYVDGNGTIRVLLYTDRPGAATKHAVSVIESFHDYISVTVKQV